MNNDTNNYPVFATLHFGTRDEDDFSLDVAPGDVVLYGMDYDEVIEKVIDKLKKIEVHIGDAQEWDNARQDAIKELEEGKLSIVVGLDAVYISVKNNFDYVEPVKPKSKKM